MTGQKLLFVGGTGTISAACVRRALDLGDEVTVLNRGRSTVRPLPPEVIELRADIREPDSVRVHQLGVGLSDSPAVAAGSPRTHR